MQNISRRLPETTLPVQRPGPPATQRRTLWPWLAALALSAACLGAPLTEAAEFHRFAAPAAWVTPLEPSYETKVPAGSADASAWVLLLDRQINVRETGDDYYQHVAVKVLNSAGIDRYSQLDLEVDPAFQVLDIHRLRVLRNGVVIDQQKLARITELPQETELRYRIYNGRYNINVVLSDVRAGDIVEYSYSLHSRELLFPGHYYDRLDTAWGIPVHRQRTRVCAPLSRDLAYRLSDGSSVPSPATVNGRRELVIEGNDIAPLTEPPSTPGWYSVWPFFEAGDRCSWADVARRVEPLYRPPAEETPRVSAALETIRAAGGTSAAQVLRALQYVQEEIRYTSMAIGRGSYEPARPELVMERRFGDCKDKSLLLVTLLKRLGVEAQVALTHTSRGRALDASLPTPYAFNHAIVRAIVDGKVYWLDPTAATQYEPLAISHHPDFERALPVGPATSGLEVIPPPAPDMRRKEITVRLDASAGMEAAGPLTVTTQFKGALADEMRPSFARGTPEQRQTDFESYTDRYYPGARSAGPVEIRDDKRRDLLVTEERYRLDRAFSPNAKGLLELTLHADELYSYAEALGAGARQAPLALEYPISIKQRIVVKLPEDWSVKADVVAVDNPAFRYRGQVKYADRTLTLDYEYEALAAFVAPEDIARFEADRARVYADLGFVLTRRGPAAKGGGSLGVAPLPMLVLLFTLALAVWAAIRWGFRYDPPQQTASANAPSGIGGWLLLPTLSVIASPIVAVVSVVNWLPAIEASYWHGLPTLVKDAYAGSAHLAVLMILVITVLWAVLAGLAAVLFFSKRTSAPLVFVALCWFAVMSGAVVLTWATVSGFHKDATTADLTGGIMRDGLMALLWTSYMFVSQRVKATFVRRRPSRLPAPPADGPNIASGENSGPSRAGFIS